MPEEMFIYDTDCTDEPLFDRGFTGHEHLYNFGLINMNGRVYDPLMSSFLSPDNYVQCPDNPQNFNRYAYCLNNPLRYTDPSGEFCWHIVIGALIGGTANLVANWDNCSGFWEYAAAFGAGAGVGAAIAATGGMGFVAGAGIAAADGFNITSPVAKGMIGGAIGGAAGGYAGAFVGGYIMTGDLDEARSAGLNSMWQGAVIGGISGGIGGYVAAKGEGINPWTGKVKNSVTIGEGMDSDVKYGWFGVRKIADDLDSQCFDPVIKKPSPELMQENTAWIQRQFEKNTLIYDRGPVHGNSPYYKMETSYIQGYKNLYHVNYYYNKQQTLRIYFVH
ncbi:MAG: hypothetical protein MJ000_05830 [Bacteroidales bacterium]|nr:hypothetical protein [Bacteroidales bacterium]